MGTMSEPAAMAFDTMNDETVARLAEAVLAELIARKNLCIRTLDPPAELDAQDVYMSVSSGLGQVQITVFNDPVRRRAGH
ncbi:hypothetical protein [Azospirillum halopraeferens]|uniref:hypothetical protein n=1 Tax=Azospirillum halopraeferens TaxID=34010 RepID=UPI00048C349B|nr:hypothetical protein [Azospirillum halopraeferens]